MYLIGRFERVHAWFPHNGASTPPFIIDKKYQSIQPDPGERWWKSESGLWYPVVRGGVGNPWRGSAGQGSYFGFYELSNASVLFSSHSLDSNYVPGTSGDAVGCRFFVTENKTLNDVYFAVDSFLGTQANINDIDVEVRSASSGLPDVSGASLETVTFDPSASGTDQWLNATGFSTSLTAGTEYWIVIGDPDGNGTDRASIIDGFNGEDQLLHLANMTMSPWRTTGGWNSGNSGLGSVNAAILLAFSDGTVMGVHPWVSMAASATDGNQKGLFLGNAFPGNSRLVGFFAGNVPDLDWESGKIWEGSTGPSGTPFATSAFVITDRTNSTGPAGCVFAGSGGYPLLTKNTDYRLVMQPASATTTRLFLYYAGPTSDANIRACFPGQGNWYYTVESGGSWSDDTDRFPEMGFLINDWEPDVSASSDVSGRVFPVFPS